MRDRMTDGPAILLALFFGGLTAALAIAVRSGPGKAALIGAGAAAAVHLTAVLASHRRARPLPSTVASMIADARRAIAEGRADLPADADPRLPAVFAEAAARVDDAATGLERSARAVALADRALARLGDTPSAGDLREARERLLEHMESTARQMKAVAAEAVLLAVRSAAGPGRPPGGFDDVRAAIEGLRREMDIVEEITAGLRGES